MANLLINTTVGGNAVITTSNIGTYAITSIPTSFSSITVTSSFDTASNDIYASMRVIRNNSASNANGMYIGYGNSGSGITRIFGGGSTGGALEKYATYTVEPGSFRAPIFYDSADTTYYLDPNSTTSLRTVGSWRSDSSTWDGEYSGKIQYHSNHWYFQSGNLWIFRNAGGSNVFQVDQSGNGTFNGDIYLGTRATWLSSYLNQDVRTSASPSFSTVNLNTLNASDTNARYYVQSTNGVPSNNLGNPTVTEMALFDEQFNNKTAFYNPASLTFWTSSDGTNYTEYTGFDTTIKKRFLGGDSDSGVYIPNLTNRFRIEVENSAGYVFLNQLYIYWSSNSHSTKVHIWVRRCDNNQWYQWTDSNQYVSSWPGHLYLPFGGIPFYPGYLDSTGHYNRIRIEFIPSWAGGTYSYTGINLMRMQIWGGYPAGKRNIYSVDENQNVNFPAEVGATSFYATNFRAANAFYLNGTSYFLNSTNGGIYTNARFETASNLVVGGNSYLGNASGDETHINDILRVGATDSGDAHFYFGEGSLAGSDYGSHWHWDSQYTFTWNTRNAGTDTALFDYVTNDTTYINWRRNFHMQNREINYTAQLHFNGGTRFVTYNSNYLYFQADSTSVGGIIVRDGNSSTRGYSGYFDSNGFGLLNSSGNWGIRLNPGNVGTELYYAGSLRLDTRSGGVGVNGNLYTDQNYGYGLVGLYASTRYQGVFAMGDSYKLTADGTGTGTLYGIAWTHTNVGGQSKSGLGHQALFMDNGTTQTAIGTGIWTNGLITTTSYGTSANWNTAFGWGNHASAGYLTSYTETDTLATVTGRGATTASQVSFTKTDDHAISVGTIRGRAVNSQGGEFIQLYERVNIGGPNGWGAANTAAPTYGLSVYGGATIGYGNSGGLAVTGTSSATGDMRAPIFYDSADTGYYLDPSGTSNLVNLTTATRARWNMPRTWYDRSTRTSDENYWTGTNGWGTGDGTWATAWKGGFSGWDIWGTGTDHPQGAGYVHAQGIVSGQHLATTDGSSGYGWMMVGAADATANRYWLRGKWGGTTSGWVEMITTGNIGSQSVASATTAGALTSMNISQFTNNSGYITSVPNLQYGGGDSLSGAGTATTWDPRGTTYDRYVIGNHTGISLHGYPGYGGVRLYAAGYPTLTTSVLRLEASDAVYTFGGLYSNGNAVIHAGNIGSQSVASATDASTLGGFGRGNTTNKVAFFDGSRNLYVNNPESYTGEVRLGAAWGRGGVYASSTLTMSTSSGDIDFVSNNTIIGAFRWVSTTGSRFIVGENVTTTPYTLIDTNQRPVIYARGKYPVLTLDHTETGNAEHGPTIQFAFNGSNARQWVIGCGGSGNFMDFGFSSAGYSNTDYNPHNGISGYLGNTIMRIIDSRVGIGGDWGAYGSVANPEHTLDVRGTIFSNTDMRAPIFYDSNNTGYYGDFASTSVMNAIRFGTSTNNGTLSGNGEWGVRLTTDSGWIQFGPANSGWAHIYSNLSFYFNQELYVNGTQVVKNSGTWGISITGNADTVDGYHMNQALLTTSSPTFQEVYANGWFRTTGHQGLYNPTNNAHFYPNNASYGSWRIDGTRNGWHGIHFDSGATLMMNSNETGVHREGYGWQFNWYNGTLYCYKNSYGGGTQATVLDSVNFTSYAQEKENQRLSTTSDVTHNSTTSPLFLVNGHSDNTKGYRVHNTSGTSVSAMFTNSSNQLVIAAGAVDQINLNKKVYVNGVALGVNFAPSSTAGRIDASNDIVAFNSSDERLKENITPIANALDKVKSLTGVEFDWKPEHKEAHGHEGRDTGIIAQQVLAVMPTAVRTNDTGYLAVRYEKLIGLLIEGMKEQQAQIEELKTKLDGLTN